MPYIGVERKILLRAGATAENVGELTFKLQQELRDYLLKKEVRYQSLAECLGALEGAKADLVNRVLTPYEEIKRDANGDVWFTGGEPV